MEKRKGKPKRTEARSLGKRRRPQTESPRKRSAKGSPVRAKKARTTVKTSPRRAPILPRSAPPARAEERLQKLLSRAGISSRRKAEELIREGRVRVNGQVVTELGTKANPARDRISVDGRPLRPAQVGTYVLLHKPVGVVTTLSDPEGRTTVKDLVRGVRIRVYPVGRLDQASSGLLLLSNDGELAMRLMHPRYEVEREYYVKVAGAPTDALLATLRRGVRLDRTRVAAKSVDVEREKDGKAWLRFIICEGRKHEVRRMCDAVGLRVQKLRRVRFGPLKLGKLAPGAHRPLTDAEVGALRRAVGLG